MFRTTIPKTFGDRRTTAITLPCIIRTPDLDSTSARESILAASSADWDGVVGVGDRTGLIARSSRTAVFSTVTDSVVSMDEDLAAAEPGCTIRSTAWASLIRTKDWPAASAEVLGGAEALTVRDSALRSIAEVSPEPPTLEAARISGLVRAISAPAGEPSPILGAARRMAGPARARSIARLRLTTAGLTTAGLITTAS